MVDRGDREPTVGDLKDAAALYALPPSDFVAARDEAVRAAKKRNDHESARCLAALRRPTTSAWLVNLLYQHQRAVVEGLLEMGPQLAEASRRLSGPQLQALSTQRSQLIQALVDTARKLASGAGVAVNATTTYEVHSTLSAALAHPDVADLVRSGRMLRPASSADFGPDPDPGMGDAPANPPPAMQPATQGSDAQASRRRNRAHKDVDDAQTASNTAQRQLAQPQEALADAQRMCEQLANDHESLRAQLADLEHRQRQATERADAAERAYRKAVHHHDEAQRRLDQARQRLREMD